jgi:hypothetical protein
VAVGDECDAVEVGDRTKVSCEREVGVTHDDAGGSVAVEAVDTVDDRAVEPSTGGPDDLGPGPLRPGRHLLVVAHDCDRQVSSRGDHPVGHAAREPGALVGGEHVGEPALGLTEALHRDKHGPGQRRTGSRRPADSNIGAQSRDRRRRPSRDGPL